MIHNSLKIILNNASLCCVPTILSCPSFLVIFRYTIEQDKTPSVLRHHNSVLVDCLLKLPLTLELFLNLLIVLFIQGASKTFHRWKVFHEFILLFAVALGIEIVFKSYRSRCHRSIVCVEINLA